MKTKPIVQIAAGLLFAIIMHPATLRAQGALTLPGPPAATMKTLDQIEARTPISSLPYTIANGGSYYLTGNLTASGSNGIVVAAGTTSFTYKYNMP